MPILNEIQAWAHGDGNHIDLSWHNPAAQEYPRVRVMRRNDRYPTHPEDGDLVAEVESIHADNLTTLDDPHQLQSETVYYYSLFPIRHSPEEFFIDRRNRASAMATAPYGFADLLFKSMPAIYHRFDKTLPDPNLDLSAVSAANRQRGQLRRFFELSGGQLDYIYSHINAAKHWKNPDKAHGNLLSLMSDWIGWKTDTVLEFDAQRKELKNAPAIYGTLGMLPVVEATVKRISNWESRSKEFVHNVALTNNPERLNLWQRHRTAGVWSDEPAVFSIDHCYEGGISCVEVAANHYYLFYHTQRKQQWDIWYIEHTEEGWLPSQKLTHRDIIDKETSAVFHDNILRVFWHGIDKHSGESHIYYRSLIDGIWSEIQSFESLNQTKLPKLILVENTLWLFWLEKIDNRWQCRYAQAQVNVTDNAIIEFPLINDFPNDAGELPRVDADLSVAYRSDPTPNFYIAWAQKNQDDSGLWQVAYRRSSDTNLALANWSATHIFDLSAGASTREPHIQIQDDGNPDLYASINSGNNGWSIWSAHLNSFDSAPGADTDTWNDFTEITAGNYSYRAPFYFQVDGVETLFYRSNQNLVHDSAIYGATQMNDCRYCGTTTVDTRNNNKMQLHRRYEDFQTYTYDTGTEGKRDNNNWIARDTVGIYLENDTQSVPQIDAEVARLKTVIKEFMPLTDRAVFIPSNALHTEYVYTFDAPLTENARYLSSTYEDDLSGVLSSNVLNESENFNDGLDN